MLAAFGPLHGRWCLLLDADFESTPANRSGGRRRFFGSFLRESNVPFSGGWHIGGLDNRCFDSGFYRRRGPLENVLL